MKRILSLIICLAYCLCLTPGIALADGENAYLQFQASLNLARKTALQNGISWSAAAYAVDDHSGDLLTTAEIGALVSGGVPRKNKLTKAEALSDIDVFFRLLKSTYGLYYYLGAAKFDSAQRSITVEIEKNSVVSYGDFVKIILKNLSFIHDYHFSIDGNQRPGAAYAKRYYYADRQVFDKDATGYYKIKGGVKWYVKAVGGSSNLSAYLAPTLKSDGSIAYGLKQLSSSGGAAKGVKSLTLASEVGQTMNEALNWRAGVNYTKDAIHTPNYKYGVKNGVPVVEIRAMQGDQKQLGSFEQSGTLLRGKKTIIIDLRSNGGGSSDHPMRWIQNFNGTKPVYTQSIAERFSKVTNAFDAKSGRQPSSRMPGTWYVGSEQGKFIPNGTNIIALVDNNAGSAGEGFIMYLRTLENVVVIGSNSAGFLMGGSNINVALPNSGMPVQLARKVNLPETAENRDGIGLEPDIWVNPKDALTLALKMVSYYGLA